VPIAGDQARGNSWRTPLETKKRTAQRRIEEGSIDVDAEQWSSCRGTTGNNLPTGVDYAGVREGDRRNARETTPT